jgi:WD40 repeat protein
MVFYTPCGNRVKVWSVLNGDLIKIFTGLTFNNSDISSFLLDALKKRMLIGDMTGHIYIFNAENGARINALPRHTTDVILLKQIYENKLFISASSDNKIHVSSDKDFGDGELLRVISLKDENITVLASYS